jgi:hypothetical protein
MAEVEGLDAHAIASEDEAVFRFAPEGKGEHPTEPFEGGGVPFEEGMEDSFGVAKGFKTVTTLTQLLAKFGVVIDFAVEDQDGIAIRAFERLVSAVEVDDAQTNGPEGDRLGLEEPLLIGSAMSQGESGSTDGSAFSPML